MSDSETTPEKLPFIDERPWRPRQTDEELDAIDRETAPDEETSLTILRETPRTASGIYLGAMDPKEVKFLVAEAERLKKIADDLSGKKPEGTSESP